MQASSRLDAAAQAMPALVLTSPAIPGMQHCMRCDTSTAVVQVHKRVRLATRIDEVLRRQSKTKADSTWRKRHAEEVCPTISSKVSKEVIASQVLRAAIAMHGDV